MGTILYNAETGGRLWYVTTGGSDGADGTVTTPVATIQHALSNAGNGDNIVVGAGTFSEQLVFPDKKIILSGQGQDRTIINQDVDNDAIVTVSKGSTIRGLTIGTPFTGSGPGNTGGTIGLSWTGTGTGGLLEWVTVYGNQSVTGTTPQHLKARHCTFQGYYGGVIAGDYFDAEHCAFLLNLTFHDEGRALLCGHAWLRNCIFTVRSTLTNEAGIGARCLGVTGGKTVVLDGCRLLSTVTGGNDGLARGIEESGASSETRIILRGTEISVVNNGSGETASIKVSQGKVLVGSDCSFDESLVIGIDPTFGKSDAQESLAGVGPYQVDHDGGTGLASAAITVDSVASASDILRYTSDGSTGVMGLAIKAYLKSEYDSGLRRPKGTTRSGSDGRWVGPLNLESGTYYVIADTAGDGFQAKQSTVVVP